MGIPVKKWRLIAPVIQAQNSKNCNWIFAHQFVRTKQDMVEVFFSAIVYEAVVTRTVLLQKEGMADDAGIFFYSYRTTAAA